MNRAISFALTIVFCVSAVSAQAAAPKAKFGNHKPVRVTKALGTNVGINSGIGNVTNPIVNTPPKAGPGFPLNPPRPIGHGPVVLNPPHHGPINGLPVPYKPQPVCGWHKCWSHDHCHDWMRYVAMTCVADCGYEFMNDCSNNLSQDTSGDASQGTADDASQGTSDDMSQGTPDDASQDMSDDAN